MKAVVTRLPTPALAKLRKGLPDMLTVHTEGSSTMIRRLPSSPLNNFLSHSKEIAMMTSWFKIRLPFSHLKVRRVY